MPAWTFAKKQLIQSMITGVPQIIRVRGRVRKLLKSLVLIFCLHGCLYQVWSFMQVYWSYPVIVDVFVSNPRQITPPAFTICDYNGIKKSRFCDKFPDLCTPKKSYTDFCIAHYPYCTKDTVNITGKKIPVVPPEDLPTNFNDSRKIYRSMGSRHYLFLFVVYGQKELSPQVVSVFNIEKLPTNCFAYNTVWGNSSIVLTKVRKEGFEIGVETGGEDNFYFSTPQAIQMSVHSPFMKVNPFTDGFSIRPCTTYKMFLQKTKKYLLPAPYPTNCTDYEMMWRARGGYGPLNQKLCIDECVFNKSIEKYGCFNPMDVFYPNEDKPFCFNKQIGEKVFEDCSQNCQPACYEEDIQVKIEEFVYPPVEGGKKDSCITGITLSFLKTQVMTFTYSRKYQVVEAFGYIGGFLGMWLGLSLIAACDFVETCLMIIAHACKRWESLRRKTKVHNLQGKKILYL